MAADYQGQSATEPRPPTRRVVLADTAGVNDMNLTHSRRNTEAYLKTAGTILVFANHKRVSKNDLLDSHLRECIHGDVCLIVTMIDDKKAYTACEREGLAEDEVEKLVNKENEVERLESRYKDVSAQKMSENDNNLFRELDREVNALGWKVTEAKAKLKQLTIQIYCRNIQEKQKGKMRDLSKQKNARDLKVFFISNLQYQKHLEGYDRRDPPILDVEATGIPALRQYLYGVPSRGKLETLQMITTSRLPYLLNGINGILTKSTLERKEEVRRVISQQLLLFKRSAPQLVQSVERLFQVKVVGVIKANDARWQEEAKKLARNWGKLKSATFAAFCRKGGHWKVPHTTTWVSWNSQIANISESRLKLAFDGLADEVEREDIAFKDATASAFKALKVEVQAASAGISLFHFFRIIDGIQEILLQDMACRLSELKEVLINIRNSVLIDGKNNFVAEAMQDT